MAFRDIDRISERIRQSRAGRLEALRRELAPGAGAGAAAANGINIGARGFDRVTGEEGVIVGRYTEYVVVPAPKR
jgi:hypothetical protein